MMRVLFPTACSCVGVEAFCRSLDDAALLKENEKHMTWSHFKADVALPMAVLRRMHQDSLSLGPAGSAKARAGAVDAARSDAAPPSLRLQAMLAGIPAPATAREKAKAPGSDQLPSTTDGGQAVPATRRRVGGTKPTSEGRRMSVRAQ